MVINGWEWKVHLKCTTRSAGRQEGATAFSYGGAAPLAHGEYISTLLSGGVPDLAGDKDTFEIKFVTVQKDTFLALV